MNDAVEEVKTEAAPEEVKESAPPEADTPDGKEEVNKEEAPPEKTFSQKEVDEMIQSRLARKTRSIERQVRAELENAQLRHQLEQREQPKQEQKPSGEPKPEQFKDYESYIDALTDYKLDKRVEAARQAAVVQQQQYQLQSYREKVNESVAKAAGKYEDFREVISGATITDVMLEAMLETDDAGEVAYYLGNNPEESAKIARLSNVAQVKAIDALNAKLKPSQQVSKAPPPAETVKGKGKSVDDLESMSLDDYMKARAKQNARWAR